MTSIIDVLDDRELLGRWFKGESWDAWRAVLKAADALPMSERDLELFRAVAERDPPTAPVKEMVVVAGRRAGKDSIASAIATHAALADYSAYLRPGERATILCLACDREQSQIVLRYVRGYFDKSPLLNAMITRETIDGLELVNNVELVVGTNDYRAVRGKGLACAVLDEAAFYPRDGSASSDTEVAAALMPGLAMLPNAKLVVISSPHMRSGLLYERWARSYGKNDPRCLVVRGGTRAFNSTFPQETIDQELELDPQRAGAEWLAEWRADLSGFIDRELWDACVDRGVVVRSPMDDVRYHAFCDASSGRSDSFVVAISHAEGKKAVLDAIMEWRAPFNAAQVVAEAAEFLRSYRLSEITGDRYAVGFVVSLFAENGVRYNESITIHKPGGGTTTLDRSGIYIAFLPLLTSGRAQLLEHPRARAQAIALERRSLPSGQDKVGHPEGAAKDDVINAVAGALVCCGGNALTGERFVEFWRNSVACAAGDKQAIAARAERVDKYRAGRVAVTAATSLVSPRSWWNARPEPPPSPVRMRSMRACANFCCSDGTRYSSDENCLVTVQPQHVQQMKTMLCSEV
jgi:hypothetical protein